MINRFERPMQFHAPLQYAQPKVYAPDISGPAKMLGALQEQYSAMQQGIDAFKPDARTVDQEAAKQYADQYKQKMQDVAKIYRDQGIAAGNKAMSNLQSDVKQQISDPTSKYNFFAQLKQQEKDAYDKISKAKGATNQAYYLNQFQSTNKSIDDLWDPVSNKATGSLGSVNPTDEVNWKKQLMDFLDKANPDMITELGKSALGDDYFVESDITTLSTDKLATLAEAIISDPAMRQQMRIDAWGASQGLDVPALRDKRIGDYEEQINQIDKVLASPTKVKEQATLLGMEPKAYRVAMEEEKGKLRDNIKVANDLDDDTFASRVGEESVANTVKSIIQGVAYEKRNETHKANTARIAAKRRAVEREKVAAQRENTAAMIELKQDDTSYAANLAPGQIAYDPEEDYTSSLNTLKDVEPLLINYIAKFGGAAEGTLNDMYQKGYMLDYLTSSDEERVSLMTKHGYSTDDINMVEGFFARRGKEASSARNYAAQIKEAKVSKARLERSENKAQINVIQGNQKTDTYVEDSYNEFIAKHGIDDKQLSEYEFIKMIVNPNYQEKKLVELNLKSNVQKTRGYGKSSSARGDMVNYMAGLSELAHKENVKYKNIGKYDGMKTQAQKRQIEATDGTTQNHDQADYSYVLDWADNDKQTDDGNISRFRNIRTGELTRRLPKDYKFEKVVPLNTGEYREIYRNKRGETVDRTYEMDSGGRNKVAIRLQNSMIDTLDAKGVDGHVSTAVYEELQRQALSLAGVFGALKPIDQKLSTAISSTMHHNKPINIGGEVFKAPTTANGEYDVIPISFAPGQTQEMAVLPFATYGDVPNEFVIVTKNAKDEWVPDTTTIDEEEVRSMEAMNFFMNNAGRKIIPVEDGKETKE